MILTKVISTNLDKLNRRLIKVLRFGKFDVQTPEEIAPFGTDANPIKDMVAIYSSTTESDSKFIVGYINKNQLAQPGEHRIYSLDSSGNLKAFIWLKNDGKIQLNGSADNAIRYGNTADTINELQDDIKSLKQAFTNWVTVPNDGGAALKAISATWAGTALQKDITLSKIDNILTS